MLLRLDLGAEFVEAVDLLIQLVDRLVFQRVVLILVVQFLDERLELLLLRFHVDGVALEVVMLLLLELSAKLLVKVANHIVELLLHSTNLRIRLQELLEALLSVGALATLSTVWRLFPGCSHRFHDLS